MEPSRRRLALTIRAAAEAPRHPAHPFEPFTTASRLIEQMTKFLLWLLLLVVCWPLALLALVVYPLVWVVLLPFRLVGVAVEGVFQLLRAVVLLPARVLRGSA